MTSRCELTVTGVLPESLLEVITARFGRPAVCYSPDTHTTVVVLGTDAASERALLNLIWDTGNDVISMRSHRTT